MKLCKQAGCQELAVYRFTWPGRDESFICAKHKPKLISIATAMGLHLQVVALRPEELLKHTGDALDKEEP